MQEIDIILASNSPRRRELLEQMGLCFEVVPSSMEEKITKAKPEEIVMELAEMKAEDIFVKVSGERAAEDALLVIGADTIVALNGNIMGKPRSEADAREMLASLQGKTHQVYTGVMLLYRIDNKIERECFYSRTDVTFYIMTDEEIQEYIDTKEPMDKAGAYGIQGRGAAFVREISGDYNNVVGLPIGELYQRIRHKRRGKRA